MSRDLTSRCIEVIADHTKVQLTADQFNEMMKDEHDLIEQLIEYDSPNDTMDRECMMEVLAKHLTGRSWPCYGDGKAARESFFQEFEENVKIKGYTLLD